MRTLSTPLRNLLASSKQFFMADLYTFTLVDGTIFRWTSAGKNMTYGGYTWYTTGPILTRGTIKFTAGIVVDELNIDLEDNGSTLVHSVPIIKAAAQGALDGCQVILKRLFLSDWNTPVGWVQLFTGNIAQVTGSRTKVQIKVKSLLDLLNIQMPKNVYQTTCLHTLYDAGCGFDKNAVLRSSSVGSVNSDGSINTSLAQAAGYFNMGVVTFTSGVNIGVTRSVKNFASGVISFPYPLPNAAGIGDTFTIVPGCDKRRTGDCFSKFANIQHFKGFEFIPVPETAT